MVCIELFGGLMKGATGVNLIGGDSYITQPLDAPSILPVSRIKEISELIDTIWTTLRGGLHGKAVKIVANLAKKGDIDLSLELVNKFSEKQHEGKIPEDFVCRALTSIVKALAKKAEYDRAIELALKLPPEYVSYPLSNISQILTGNSDFLKAEEVARMIPNRTLQLVCLGYNDYFKIPAPQREYVRDFCEI